MRLRILAPVAAAFAGMCAIAWAATTPATSPQAETYRQLDLFADVLARVKANYVTETDEPDLMRGAIDGLLASLDPHSSYMDPKEFEDFQTSVRGEYEGLGVEVSMQDRFVTIVTPFDGSPAARAGLKSGDRITAVNGQKLLGLTLNQALEKMRGEVNSVVTITIFRDEVEPFDVTLKREIVSPPSVTWRREGDVGYLRLSGFNEKTAGSFSSAIESMRKAIGPRLKGVVLDLRNNPGGLLDQAVAVADVFLDGGEVVSSRGRDPRDTQRLNAQRGEMLRNVPVAVIINEGSASAAEIVAGALQDRQRAKIVGVTSFGKGSVQTVIPLKGGFQGALRLTTARYYTPSGRSIQATGIEPDVEVAQIRGAPEKRAIQSEADLPEALDNDGGIKRKAPHEIADQPPEGFKGDYQLKRALEVVQGLPGPKLPVIVAKGAETPASSR